jgi:hypothetical protein
VVGAAFVWVNVLFGQAESVINLQATQAARQAALTVNPQATPRGTLRQGVSIIGRLDFSQPSQTWRLPLTEGGRVQLELFSSAFPPLLEIYAPDGRLVVRAEAILTETESVQADFFATQSGEYQVVVLEWGWGLDFDGGTYRLIWR